jgi:hypothetical protein
MFARHAKADKHEDFKIAVLTRMHLQTLVKKEHLYHSSRMVLEQIRIRWYREFEFHLPQVTSTHNALLSCIDGNVDPST